jgi:hypothetical protein
MLMHHPVCGWKLIHWTMELSKFPCLTILTWISNLSIWVMEQHFQLNFWRTDLQSECSWSQSVVGLVNMKCIAMVMQKILTARKPQPAFDRIIQTQHTTTRFMHGIKASLLVYWNSTSSFFQFVKLYSIIKKFI